MIYDICEILKRYLSAQYSIHGASFISSVTFTSLPSPFVGHQPDGVDPGILPLLPRARRLCGAQPDEGWAAGGGLGEGEGSPKKDRWIFQGG